MSQITPENRQVVGLLKKLKDTEDDRSGYPTDLLVAQKSVFSKKVQKVAVKKEPPVSANDVSREN